MISTSLLVLILLIAADKVTKADIDNDDGLIECLPQLADRCFKEVYDKLPCRLKKNQYIDACRNEWAFVNAEFKTFCDAIDDSLSCSSDIIDTSCTVTDGRNIFDTWLNGLGSVYTFLCQNPNETLKILIDNAYCWDSSTFMSCTSEMTGIHHVVDIMNLVLDINGCINVISAVGDCNFLASRPFNQSCQPQLPKEVIGELTHVFFTQTTCNSKIILSNSNSIQYQCSCIFFILYSYIVIKFIF